MEQYKINKITTSVWINILIGSLLIVFGVAFLISQEILTIPIAILFGSISLYHLFHFVLRLDLKNQIHHLVQGLLFILLAFVFSFREQFLFSTLGLFLVFWALVNTLLKGMNIYFYRMINQSWRLSDIIAFVINSSVTVLLIISSQIWSRFFVISFSLYLIYYGFELVLLAFRDKKIRLPSFISTFLPARLVRDLERGTIKAQPHHQLGENSSIVNIYVYMGERFQDKVGHVDIGYQGIVYSYGAHDPFHRNRFFLWGDGVLIKADEKKFVETALTLDSKTIIKFVYHLSSDEEEALKKQIKEMMEMTVFLDWDTKLEDDYLATLINAIGTNDITTYKFNETSFFHTYNLFKVNCVLLAYYLLNQSQVKLFDIYGLITPGAYYETLLYIYNLDNSPISEMIILKGQPLHLSESEYNRIR